MRSPPLLFFSLAIVGALIGLSLPITIGSGALLFAFVGISACLSQLRWLKAMLVCIALSAFVATEAAYQKAQFDNALKSLPTEATLFEGTLLDLSDTLSGDKIGLLEIMASSGSNNLHESFTVSLKITGAASAKPVRIGDILRIKAKISKPHHALSPGQVDGYWLGLSRGVLGRIVVSNPHLITVMRPKKSPSIIASIKQALKGHLANNLTPRETGLLLALIVGDIKLFEEDQQAQYRNIGAGHLLAVSGLQVSLLSFIFYRLFLCIFLLIPWISRRSLARYPALALTLVFIWTFVALCGSPPSAFRAALMTTLVLCASAYAWPTTSMDVFGATGLISLLVRPSAVVDPSFWLSYAAVFGLIIAAQAAQLSPSDLLLLDPEKSQSPWQTKLRTLIVSSVGAGFLTLPFSAFYFAEVSLSGLIINLFLVPVAGFLQTPAILLVAIGCASNIPFFSSAAAFCAGVLDAMCMSLDDLLGHTYPMMPLSVFQLLLAFIAAVFLIKIAQARKRICKLSVAFLCIAIAFVPTFFSKRDSLEVTFLPVGQGDAAVIESPTGEVMVIDGGGNHDDTYNPGERIISPFLRRRHIQAIDVVVLSHPDADHLMGLLPLFENFEVKELWHNGFDESHPLMARLLEVARAHHVKLRTPEDFGEKIAFGRATITFISLRALTPQSPKLTSTNNRSLVLKIAFENQSILFPGDIEEIMENEFAKTRQDLSATIIKAPHHGSKSSSSANFVNAANASHVVFCTGINNRFGFPHSQVIKRWQDHGATLWNTAVNGETTFSLSRESVEVRPYIAISEDES